MGGLEEKRCERQQHVQLLSPPPPADVPIGERV